MQFDGLALGIGVLALILVLIGLKLLLNLRWVLGWLRGNIGMFLILLSALLGISILDIRTYQPMVNDRVIGTLSFEQKGAQKFRVRLVDNKGMESTYNLSGDAWKMTAKVIDWAPSFYVMGMMPGYRLDTFQGKYFSLFMERKRVSPEVVINRSEHIDLWNLATQYLGSEGFMRPKLATVPAQTMVDGAQYELIALNGKISARPLNDAARKAL